MKYLVLGSSGMVGHMVCLYLIENGHEVTGYSRRRIDAFNSIEGDVRDLQKLTKLISENCYDAVINAVGILNNMAEEDKESAVFINSYLPHFLSKLTEKCSTQLVHISTDCIFAGNRAPYSEKDIADGISFYSRTKAIGEIVDSKNVTLRTSIVGPDMNKNGIGLLNWFMVQKGEVNGYSKVIWTGITSLELAKIIERCTVMRIHGLFNMVNDHSISKYDLLKLFNDNYRGGKVTIKKSEDVCKDMSLIRTDNSFHYEIPDYKSMISELGTWMSNHNSLYPHYELNNIRNIKVR